MKPRTNQQFCGALIALTCLALVAGTNSTRAQDTQVVNFDTLSGTDSGSVVIDYLAGFGITVTDVTPGTKLYAQDDRLTYGAPPRTVVQASSGDIYLMQGGANNGESFTLNFSQPLTDFAFTRITELGGSSGVAYPTWSATVYESATEIGSVGENAQSIWSGQSSPAQTYSFTGSGITSVTFYGNGNNHAAFPGPMIDDLSLTPIPEPTTWALVSLAIGAFLGFRSRRFL